MARLQGHARNDGTVDPSAQGSGTRERILDISLELFTTQGYDKTSLREIAEHLGFSKAAIYYHFESKEAILDGAAHAPARYRSRRVAQHRS